MSLSHDGFSFFSAKHGPVSVLVGFDLPIVFGQFFGVNGESHLIGDPYGRELSCELVMDGYTGTDDLESDLRTLDTKIGALTGTLTETIGGDDRTWGDCTFLGYQTDPRGPFKDGSGQNGWVLFLRLFWRQRKRYTAS